MENRTLYTDIRDWFHNTALALRSTYARLRSQVVVFFKTNLSALKTKWSMYRNNFKRKRVQFIVHNSEEFKKLERPRTDIVGNLPEEIGVMILE